MIALPVPDPYSNFGRITSWKIDESLPDGVAAFVDWLVNRSGWTVTEREHPDDRVPIQARHVCLLFRRFRSFNTDVTRPYVRALEARRLPHLLVGGTGFHTREEVEAVRNALGAIERPDDELAVFATLKGPLFALSDSQVGLMNSAFIWLYALVGLPLGRMADTWSRKKLLASGMLVWSALTAASGMCTSFAQLFVVRLGVGLGEASCAPAASSLIGDMFPAHKRSNALSVFMLGLPIGIALSFLVGGYIAKPLIPV